MKFILGFILTLNSLSFADIFVNRSCNSYNISNYNFQLNKVYFILNLIRFHHLLLIFQLEGKWYEVAKYGSPDKCTTYFFTPFDSTHSNVTRFSGTKKDGYRATTCLMIQKNPSSIDCELKTGKQNISAKMIATDYYNYGVLWTCTNLTYNSSSRKYLHSVKKNLASVTKIINLRATDFSITITMFIT